MNLLFLILNSLDFFTYDQSMMARRLFLHAEF